MQRAVDLSARLAAGVTRACRVLAHLEEDFVTELELDNRSEDVRIQFTSVDFNADGAVWRVSIGPVDSTTPLPLFSGELHATGSSRGTDLTLRGTYRLGDATGDRIEAHINACGVVHAFLDDLVLGIDTPADADFGAVVALAGR